MKQFVFTAVRVVISGLLIFLMVAPAAKTISPAFPLVDIGNFPEIIRNVEKGYLLLAVFLSLVSATMLAWRWKIVTLNNELSFSFLLRLTFIGMFFNNFLPTGAGGDIVKGYYLLRGRQKKLDLGISIFMDRMVGTISIMTMGFIALLFFPYLPGITVFLIIAIYLSLLFFLLIVAWPHKILRNTFLSRIRGKPAETIRHLYYGIHNYLQDPLPLLRALLVSFACQVIAIFANYLVTVSLRAPVPPGFFFVSIPLIWSFTAIPSLGGLGVREASYLFFFQERMGQENAFTLSLIVFSFYLLNSLIGGVIYFFGGVKWQKKN